MSQMKNMIFGCVGLWSCATYLLGQETDWQQIEMLQGNAIESTIESEEIIESSDCEEASQARMDVYKLMMNVDDVVAFLSHPKVVKYFEIVCMQRDAVIRKAAEGMEKLFIDFPEQRVDLYAANPILLNQELSKLHALITWGVFDTSEIEDPQTLLQIQGLQARCYKNYLARRGVCFYDVNIYEDLLLMTRDSSISLFHDTLFHAYALLQQEEVIGQFDCITSSYDSCWSDRASWLQHEELDKLFYDSFLQHGLSLLERDEVIMDDISSEMFSDNNTDPGTDLAREDAFNDAVDAMFQDLHVPEVVTAAELVTLFMEVLQERHPERQEEFLQIYDAFVSSSL